MAGTSKKKRKKNVISIIKVTIKPFTSMCVKKLKKNKKKGCVTAVTYGGTFM